MMIYKIFRADEWRSLQSQGETNGAPIDLADGYIHFSTAQQAQDTADKHFANVENLFLAAVETDTLDSAIKWEVSRGGAEFPHLYDKLKLSDVVWCQPLLLMDGRHKFPEGLT
jgi:uncharacterized protein (DUF952 family)